MEDTGKDRLDEANMKRLIIPLVIALVLIPGVLAQASREEAGLALNASYLDLREMKDAKFSVTMVTDLLAEAEQLFNAQVVLEEMGGTPDYERVMEKTVLISETKRQAVNTYDEIEALELSLTELEGINKTAVQIILDSAKKEFQDERYEKAGEFVEKAYEKISEEQAVTTKIAFFLESSRKNIVNFFMTNWATILSSAIGLVIFFMLFRSEISKLRIKRKIKKLEIRKGVLNEMIKRLQHGYFEVGNVSEGTYKLKIEKFKQFLRDIERRKPLLREELEKRHSIISRFRKP